MFMKTSLYFTRHGVYTIVADKNNAMRPTMTESPQDRDKPSPSEVEPDGDAPSHADAVKLRETLFGAPITDEGPHGFAQRILPRPAREERLVTLSATRCRILPTIAKDLYYLIDNIALFKSLTTPSKITMRNGQPTIPHLIRLKSALTSVETFLSGINADHKTSGWTLAQNLLPHSWHEEFPAARNVLVEGIGNINKSLGRRCKKPDKTRDMTTTGEAKPILEYLQALDRVHHTLNVNIPLNELDKNSISSKHIPVEDRRKITRFLVKTPIESLIESLRKLKFSEDDLAELSKLEQLQELIISQADPKKLSPVPVDTVPGANSLRKTLSNVRQRLIASISDLPESVSSLYEEGTLTPLDLGRIIRAANKRSMNDDTMNHEHIIGPDTEMPLKHYNAAMDIQNFKEAFQKLNLCHSIDLTLAIVTPVLATLEEKARRQESSRNQQWQR